MMRHILVSAVVISLLLSGMASGGDGVSYSGSSTIGQGILQVGEAVKAFTKKTGIKFTSVEVAGSGAGIKAILDGKVSLAGASRPLSDDEIKKGLSGHTIGFDAIAVFVNKNNQVKNLTREQLKGIFTGKIKNWKDVGGIDAPITPNTEMLDKKRATIAVFQELVMDNAPYGKGFKEIDLPKDQLVYLAGNETGICAVSIGLSNVIGENVHKKIKLVTVDGSLPIKANIRSGSYLISRPLLLVTKGQPKDAVKSFIDFMLSDEGQAIVERDFVSVKQKKSGK